MSTPLTICLAQNADGSRITRPAEIGTTYWRHAIPEFLAVLEAAVEDDNVPGDVALGQVDLQGPFTSDCSHCKNDSGCLASVEVSGVRMLRGGSGSGRELVVSPAVWSHDLRQRPLCLQLAGLTLSTLIRVAERLICSDLFLVCGQVGESFSDSEVAISVLKEAVSCLTDSAPDRDLCLIFHEWTASPLFTKKFKRLFTSQLMSDLALGESTTLLRGPAEKKKALALMTGAGRTMEGKQNRCGCLLNVGVLGLSGLGGGHLALDLGRNRVEAYLSSGAVAASGATAEGISTLTACKPALALLMANLAKAVGGAGQKILLDPYLGSGGLLEPLAEIAGSPHSGFLLGSDISLTERKKLLKAASVGPSLSDRSGVAVDRIQASVFALPYRTTSSAWCDAILFDPPFGLRENLDSSFVQSQVHSSASSQCYIQDHSGEELLQRVSAFVGPVLELGSTILRPGGRVVYLFPVFPSQRELGLWADPDEAGREEARLKASALPRHPCFRLYSCDVCPCRKKHAIARIVVTMERLRGQQRKEQRELSMIQR